MNAVLPTVMLLDGSTPPCRFLRVSLRARELCNDSGQTLSSLSCLAEQAPDAIILDLGCPDQESWAMAQQLTESFHGPVILITNTPAETPHLATVPAATGTYSLPKYSPPLAAAEYQARKHVSQRLARTTSPTPVFQIEELRVDLEQRLITLQGREIHLTPSEFRLLALMIEHAGKVLTHSFLLEAVWGADRTDDIQSLRVYMSSLRRKIELDPAHPRYLMTIQSIGYRLQKPQ